MRLPLSADLLTRDGTLTKDARLVNAFNDDGGVTKRPGNIDLGLVDTGVAQLLWYFNLPYAVIDDTLSSIIITGDVATSTVVAALSPITADLPLTAQTNGEAQSQQQLFIKSNDQAWVYTP